ncbi:Na/Pi cotransporter family protein [Mycoplasma sp. 1654_15]|uniref:Na/Pi cotransporter family protein n=1 Tax=Mycoplasma sp. 1654_15 TaxID=2725994 RepID=UPI0014496040|nr:Na/Pi cotransporter family protein [Mycoplasma sp. 1654_15]QJB71347.1 Na/Pi cotransporter family protein [Mycoplasma sp. 1654_15]
MLFDTWYSALIFALAGLALFIFSAKILSTSLKQISGPKFKKQIFKISENRFAAMLFGIIFTTLIQSSDGSMALIMGLLAAGLIKLRGAIAFLLGANIGTATTSLIVSFQARFAFTEYFVLLLVIGIFGYMLVKKEKWSNIFYIIFAIGLIFLSLKLLSSGSKVIVKQEWFKSFVKQVGKNAWASFFFSFVLTGIMQSSSATVTLYQSIYEGQFYNDAGKFVLSKPEILSLPAAIGLVFGANVGTTVTGFIVSFTTKNINSKKIAIVWGFTNLSISILILAIIFYFSQLIELMIPLSLKAPSLQLSIAHLLFNAILVAIFIFLITYIVRFLDWLIKDDHMEKKFGFTLTKELIKTNNFLALEQGKQALTSMGKMVYEGLEKAEELTKKRSTKLKDQYNQLEEVVDNARKKLYFYLIELGQQKLTTEQSEIHMSLILSSRSLEKILDIGAEILAELDKVYDPKNKTQFLISQEVINHISELIKMNKAILQKSTDQIKYFKKERSHHIEEMSHDFDELSFKYAKENVSKLKSSIGKTQLDLDFDYSRVLRSLERINHHSLRINHYLKNSHWAKLNIY